MSSAPLPTSFGRYQVLEELGAGAMGVVYLCVDPRLNRPVAIKVMRESEFMTPADREQFEARFQHEAQAAGRLTHPDIVQIYDVGPSYIVMEFLEGQPLSSLMRRGERLAVRRVVELVRRVADAVDYAHRHGIIHRDIKPANVILCRRGKLLDVAKVVDFGLVKDLQAHEPVEVTAANTIAGTPLYLSPEAITNGETVGPESDLYALGAVGYFLLTGRPPFEGTLIEVCGHHLHTVPRPPSERLGRSLPRQLEAVLLRCLEKDPARRLASASELAAALGACAGPDLAEWTQVRASAWWREHASAAEAEPGEADDSTLTRTMAVSLE